VSQAVRGLRRSGGARGAVRASTYSRLEIVLMVTVTLEVLPLA
jgi:hypothetical protein